jgi:hypothetical protein
MAKQNTQGIQASITDNDDFDEYDDMEILELLESLREDMEELGVTTLSEIIQRIDELHKKLDKG